MNFRGVRQGTDAFHQVIPDLCVALHDRTLFVGKRPRFEENGHPVRRLPMSAASAHGNVSHLAFEAPMALAISMEYRNTRRECPAVGTSRNRGRASTSSVGHKLRSI